jgi:hypothetical protein
MTVESITMENWFAGAPSVFRLQVIDPTQFDADVKTYNFMELADRYGTSTTSVRLIDELARFQMTASDTTAFGGDLAFQYAVNDSLSGISVISAHAVLDSPSFGTGAQALSPVATLQQGTVKLL